MGNNSKISFCEHTVNFWTGCKKVSKGCKNCYMFKGKERWKQDPTVIVKANPQTVKTILRKTLPGDKIFTCSWSDFFIEEADQWRAEAWEIIKQNRHVYWIIITKRAERIAPCLPDDWFSGAYNHVWLGVTCENQQEFEFRYPFIARHYGDGSGCKTFISFEPLLEPIDLKIMRQDGAIWRDNGKPETILPWLNPEIDWLIIGGESGNATGKYKARPCQVEWMEKLVDEFTHICIPVFVKQMGSYLASKDQLNLTNPKGEDINEFPEELRIREFPIYPYDYD